VGGRELAGDAAVDRLRGAVDRLLVVGGMTATGAGDAGLGDDRVAGRKDRCYQN
jgi:hypothetical protein